MGNNLELQAGVVAGDIVNATRPYVALNTGHLLPVMASWCRVYFAREHEKRSAEDAMKAILFAGENPPPPPPPPLFLLFRRGEKIYGRGSSAEIKYRLIIPWRRNRGGGRERGSFLHHGSRMGGEERAGRGGNGDPLRHSIFSWPFLLHREPPFSYQKIREALSLSLSLSSCQLR